MVGNVLTKLTLLNVTSDKPTKDISSKSSVLVPKEKGKRNISFLEFL